MKRLLQQLRIRRQADVVPAVAPARREEQEPAAHEHQPAQQHADAGEAEARPPADRRAKPGAQHLRPEGAEVDAVIVEREAGIAARIVLRVELADDRSRCSASGSRRP